VSLNNRISIRDASVACGGVVRSPTGSFPRTDRSETTTDIVFMEMEKSSNDPKIRPLKDVESQGRIIGELRLFVLHVSLTFPFSPHSNRHRMNLATRAELVFSIVEQKMVTLFIAGT
jgi:hypothetical protein